MIPATLYVHLPWCPRKCPYCDFNSHGIKDAIPERAYRHALLADLELDLPLLGQRPVEAIFFGGGTPSLLSAAFYDQLLREIGERLSLNPAAEVTLEANPGALESRSLAAYGEAGINRLSLGAQSFSDRALARIGRIHSAWEVAYSFRAARAAGFTNINLDLMFGLPQQTLGEAQADIQQALARNPEHISHYPLTLEPGTPFGEQPPPLPAEELVWEMQQVGLEQLSSAGYTQYEISNFARRGWRCAHNLNYWHFGDYLGIGAGAHGKLSHLEERGWHRTYKPALPESYLGSSPGHMASVNGWWLRSRG